MVTLVDKENGFILLPWLGGLYLYLVYGLISANSSSLFYFIIG